MRHYDPPAGGSHSASLKAFRRARWQALMEQVRSRFRGQPAELLCYWEVQEILGSEVSHKTGVQEIRLSSIIGSVEQCTEYTRGFLPLHDGHEERWLSIKEAFTGSKPLPPILVLQVGEVYFVVDGNHRVSVARQSGRTHIQASVVQIQTKVRLSSRDRLSDLLLKLEYARFLEHTCLDEIRPEANLRLTVPGRFQALEAQLEGHRAFLALDQRCEITPTESAADWYDNIYLPVVRAIRNECLLRDFPGWTEADLYLALCEHRIALEAAVGHRVQIELAAVDLARQLRPRSRGGLAQLRQALARAPRRRTA